MVPCTRRVQGDVSLLVCTVGAQQFSLETPAPPSWQRGAAASWGLGDLSWTGPEAHGAPLPVFVCLRVFFGRCRIDRGRRPAPAERHGVAEASRAPRPHLTSGSVFVCSGWWAGAGRSAGPPKRAGPLPTVPAVAGQRVTWVCEPWHWPLLLAPSTIGGAGLGGHCVLGSGQTAGPLEGCALWQCP